MLGAGKLDRRVRFEARAATDDGYGNTVSGDFAEQFTVWAHRRDLRGGEAVQSARLAGQQPAIFTVRNSSTARQIVEEWRLVDLRTGQIFNIRERPRETEDRLYLEMLAQAGGAT